MNELLGTLKLHHLLFNNLINMISLRWLHRSIKVPVCHAGSEWNVQIEDAGFLAASNLISFIFDIFLWSPLIFGCKDHFHLSRRENKALCVSSNSGQVQVCRQ